jgi:putative Ca2+/H+ antiporter (TMEM165/GDT1 family)
MVNAVWATILPADYLILAIGAAFIILGMWEIRKKSRTSYAKEERPHH